MKYILLISTILFSTGLFGQRDEGNHREKRERMESMRVAYLTEKMNLSAEDAQVFWPIMNKYEEQYKAMRTGDRKRGTEESNDIGEKEAKAMYEQHLANAQKKIDLTKDLVNELEQHLTSVQIMHYLKAEESLRF